MEIRRYRTDFWKQKCLPLPPKSPSDMRSWQFAGKDVCNLCAWLNGLFTQGDRKQNQWIIYFLLNYLCCRYRIDILFRDKHITLLFHQTIKQRKCSLLVVKYRPHKEFICKSSTLSVIYKYVFQTLLRYGTDIGTGDFRYPTGKLRGISALKHEWVKTFSC